MKKRPSTNRLRPNHRRVDRFDRIEDLAFNVAMSRSAFAKQMFDPNRDYNKECGYPETQELVSFGSTGMSSPYRQMFDREPIAKRVVELFPKECWRVQPTVFEDDSTDEETEFEAAWDVLGRELQGENFYQDEKGSPIWEYLERIDILSGIGSYGLLLIGLDDGLALDQPVKGMEDKKSSNQDVYAGYEVNRRNGHSKRKPVRNAEIPLEKEDEEETKDTTKAELDEGGDDQVDPGNKEAAPKTARKLIYLRAFDESLCQVSEFEKNRKSPRFGLPIRYSISINDPAENTQGGIGVDTATVTVHWTRVIHVSEHMMTNECFGVPRMRPVLNRLIDLVKLYGGSAEMYWKGAFPGISFETIPQMGGDVTIDKEALKAEIQAYNDSLQRHLALFGMQAKVLSPTVVDPTPQIDAQIQAICIQLGVPQRIFMGSERGELSSGQDATEWNNRLYRRQQMYVTPRIIVPFVNRLILMGVLPTPKGFSVIWPKPHLAPQDRANLANLITTALGAYVQQGVNTMIPSRPYMVEIIGMEEDVVDAILKQAVEDLQDEEMDGEGGDADPLKIEAVKAKEEAAEQAEMQMEQAQMQADALAEGQTAQIGMQQEQEVGLLETKTAGDIEKEKLKAKLKPPALNAWKKFPDLKSALEFAAPGDAVTAGEGAREFIVNYNPSQPRGADGKWGPDTGGSFGGSGGREKNWEGEWHENPAIKNLTNEAAEFPDSENGVELDLVRGAGPKESTSKYEATFWTDNPQVASDYRKAAGGDTVRQSTIKIDRDKIAGPKTLRRVAEEVGISGEYDFDLADSTEVQDALRDEGYQCVKFVDVASGSDSDEHNTWLFLVDPENHMDDAELTDNYNHDQLRGADGKWSGGTGSEARLQAQGDPRQHYDPAKRASPAYDLKLPKLGTVRYPANPARQAAYDKQVKEIKGKDDNYARSLGFEDSEALAKFEEDSKNPVEKEPIDPPPDGYEPNVESKDDTGVTHASRVGVPGQAVPPSPPVPKLPNLTPQEREVEGAFMKAFNDDPEGMASSFKEAVLNRALEKSLDKGVYEPPTFGTDDAKELSDKWSGDQLSLEERSQNRAVYNLALHQTANSVAKRAFLEHLDTMEAGQEVLVTVGGCGAGKGYALNNVPQAAELEQNAGAVWDSAGDQNATENPWIQKEAEARGLKVAYAYVHADPENQWAHPKLGVVARAQDPKDGRMVDAQVFADSYAIGARNHQAFYEANRDNPNAKFVFLKNAAKPELLEGIPREALNLDRKALANFAHKVIDDNPNIPAHIKRGATIGRRIWKNELTDNANPNHDAKGRFAVSPEQGVKRSKTPGVGFHVTDPENLASIAKKGLSARTPVGAAKGFKPAVYLADKQHADVSEGEALLRVVIPKGSEVFDDTDARQAAGLSGTNTDKVSGETAFFTVSGIPADSIQVRDGNKWIPIKDYKPKVSSAKIDPNPSLLLQWKDESDSQFAKRVAKFKG